MATTRRIVSTRLIVFVLLLMCGLLSFGGGFGDQTSLMTRVSAQPDGSPVPTPTPESEEIKRLREEKTRAELERDIATAEKARNDANFPKPSTSPLSGETKVNDGAVIESDMISYMSMGQAAKEIVSQLKTATSTGGITNLAIYNKSDIDLILNYKATNAQLKILRQEFCKLVPAAPQCGGPKIATRSNAPLSIVGSFLGAFVDMTALLRTNVTIQGHTTDINEAALVSEVFRAARQPCLNEPQNQPCLPGPPNLYYPAAFPPTDPTLQTSELLLTLEDLHDLKALVIVAVHDLKDRQKAIAKLKTQIATLKGLIEDAPDAIGELEAELATLQKIKKELAAQHKVLSDDKLIRLDQLPQIIGKLKQDLADAPGKKATAELSLNQALNGSTEDDISDLISRINLVNERFDQLVATLIRVDSGTGINSLTAYIRAENLIAVLKDPNSYWLQLAVIKAGGNNRIKSNLITDIFTGGSRLSHSGGVIVQYNLYGLTGKSIVSDTFTQYTGYIKAGRVKDLKNP